MNKVIMLGRLVKDPEVRYTTTQKVVVTFNLAVDRPYAGQDGKREADFFNCQLWGKRGEALANYVHKGQRVLVEGRIQNRKYTDKQNIERYITEVICDSFEFIEKSESKGASQTQEQGFNEMGSQLPFDEEIPF